MEEAKTQNIQDSVKYYCRVCTTNTRSKKSKPGDGIGIFEKEGLKSILERYLQLHISKNDHLPKVICRVCYEKIEAVEFLRVMARRTESLLKDFLKTQSSQNQFQNEYNTFAISLSTGRQPAKPDEVVVNVSLSDPLTKDINKKLLGAQRRKDSLDKAFSPSQIGANAVTSSPNVGPLTIVHQMPRKKTSSAINLIEKRKNLQMALTNATTVTLEPPPPVTTAIKLPMRPKMSTAPPPPPLRHISEAPAIPQKVEIHPVITEHTAGLGHAITLGSIIKDEDLLRLILKALKWPFNNQTIDIQIQRLKNTNFGDIIVDPNLLQDEDLIQILGPLIHPTMTALPTNSQQTYIAIPPESGSLPPSTISYKLPAETSVQIITVPPEEKVTPPKAQPKPPTANVRNVVPTKKRRSAQKFANTGVIVVSDESEDDSLMEIRETDNVQRFEVQLDPAMYQDASESSNSNEAMLATLNRQRAALMRCHRSKRKQSLIGANIEMVDDIMIVDEGVHLKEPYPEVVLVKKRRRTPPPVIMPTASTSSLKPMSSSTQPAKKISAPPPMLAKATTAPLRKPTTTPSSIRKVSQAEMPGLTKLPPKKDIQRIAVPQAAIPTTSLQSSKSTTLADADSTTKIIVKESKLPKDQKAFADIEEQITKVRIGKPVHKPVQSEGSTNPNNPIADGEVVIVVEYEAENEELTIETVEEAHKVVEVIAAPQVELQAQESAAKPNENEKLPEELPQKSDDSVLPSMENVEIKEEEEEVTPANEVEEPLNEDISPEFDEKKEDIERSKTPDSDVSKTTNKTESPRYTRSKHNQKKLPKRPQQQTATTTFRPARKSKTLSKYYKGPPATSETAGRSMRSRS